MIIIKSLWALHQAAGYSDYHSQLSLYCEPSTTRAGRKSLQSNICFQEEQSAQEPAGGWKQQGTTDIACPVTFPAVGLQRTRTSISLVNKPGDWESTY